MIIKPTHITPEILEMYRPPGGNLWHWAMNLNAVLDDGYCDKCKLVPVGCAREGCGECKGREDEKGALATLRAKAEAWDKLQNSSAEYDEAMEINAQQVEEWRKKADAYGKGEEVLEAVKLIKDVILVNVSEKEYMEKNGYTCRRVRVCESEVEG